MDDDKLRQSAERCFAKFGRKPQPPADDHPWATLEPVPEQRTAAYAQFFPSDSAPSTPPGSTPGSTRVWGMDEACDAMVKKGMKYVYKVMHDFPSRKRDCHIDGRKWLAAVNAGEYPPPT